MLLRTIACLAIGALLLLGGAACIKESALTVAIHEDGTVTTTSSITFAREAVEERLEYMDAMEDEFAGDEDSGAGPVFSEFEDEEPAKDKAEGEVKGADGEKPAGGEKPSGPDAALEAKVRRALLEDAPAFDPNEAEFALDTVEIEEEAVRIQVTFTFKTLEAFVKHVDMVVGSWGVDHVVLDTNENGKLRLTISPADYRSDPEWLGAMLGTLEEAGYSGTFTYTMPGAIVSSTLPSTEEATTSIEVDATTAEGKQALASLYKDEIVIVAEPGALALDSLPLDSAEFAVDPFRGGEPVGADVEITDAEGDYMAEPLYVTTTLVRVFPEAEAELQARLFMLLDERASVCSVQAELYAPEDRIIADVGDIRVTRAVDDQGREVKPFGEEEDAETRHMRRAMSLGRGEDEHTFRFTVQLELPPKGAMTIDEIEGELIATTFTGWNEHELLNPKTAPKTPIDIGDIVPGATLYIGRIVNRTDEDGDINGSISVKITGPPQVSDIEIEVRSSNEESNVDSYGTQTTTSAEGEQVTYMTKLDYYVYSYGEDAAEAAPELTLVLKVRDDLKRERVKFLLEAVDLF